MNLHDVTILPLSLMRSNSCISTTMISNIAPLHMHSFFPFLYFGLSTEVSVCLIFSSCSEYPHNTDERWFPSHSTFLMKYSVQGMSRTLSADQLNNPLSVRSWFTLLLSQHASILVPTPSAEIRQSSLQLLHKRNCLWRGSLWVIVEGSCCWERGLQRGLTAVRLGEWQAVLPRLLFLITGTNLWGFVTDAKFE